MDNTESPQTQPPLPEAYAKLLIDHLKHVTTLSTGSIFLQVAFLEKIFPHPKWKIFFVLSLLLLTASIYFASSSMEMVVNMSAPKPLPAGIWQRAADFASSRRVWSWRLFVWGVIALLPFALRNLLALN